jgi:DUF917 family protein
MMPDGTIRTQQQAEDFIRGLTLLGTGGGGHPGVGRQYLLRHIEAGRSVNWIDLSKLPDEAWACVVFSMGSIAHREPLSAAERKCLGYGAVKFVYPMTEAVQELARYTGQEIEAVVPFELGAGNTSGPLDVATSLGIACVDADCAGRAIPELAQTIVAIEGHSLWPAAICDTWGNRLILQSAPSALVAERLGKMISTVTRHPDSLATCAHAGFLLPAGQMKKLVIPGTLTLALEVGSAIRVAREDNRDPLQAAVNVLGGWVLFTGTITSKEWESRDGYMFGTTFIEGTGEFRGHTLKIWFQNENHVTWYDETPYVTSPDLIMVVDQASAEPFINTDLRQGQQVAVLGSTANKHYRTAQGLAALGPPHFGFDLPYRPIETLVPQRLSEKS